MDISVQQLIDGGGLLAFAGLLYLEVRKIREAMGAIRDALVSVQGRVEPLPETLATVRDRLAVLEEQHRPQRAKRSTE